MEFIRNGWILLWNLWITMIVLMASLRSCWGNSQEILNLVRVSITQVMTASKVLTYFLNEVNLFSTYSQWADRLKFVYQITNINIHMKNLEIITRTSFMLRRIWLYSSFSRETLRWSINNCNLCLRTESSSSLACKIMLMLLLCYETTERANVN